jgi:hypothetical protein
MATFEEKGVAMGEILVTIGVTLVVVALAVWAWRGLTADRSGPARTSWDRDGVSGTRVRLDLEDVDPDSPAVQRLVRETAHRILARDPSLDEVEVVDRTGRTLARERRPSPLPPEVSVPEALREPHARGGHTPSPVAHDDGHLTLVPGAAPEVRSVPLAERYELSLGVRARLEDPDDGAGLVQAILAEAGREPVRDGELVRAGDVAIAVVDVHGDPEQALSRGFLRIEATDAARGIVLRLGFVDPVTIRRREAAAPHVRHVGPDAIQRMADAAAAGADPIAFAVGPATIS